MSVLHLFAAPIEPAPREFECLADLEVTSDAARLQGTDCVWREITGKICRRGLVWEEFISFWKQKAHEPIQAGGLTYFGAKFIKVDYDRFNNFVYLNLDSSTLRMILMETHRGTIEEWEVKRAKRTKRVKDFLDHVRGGQFSRNDYRELMGHERLSGAHMNEVFPADIKRDLMKGIEVFPIWKKKTQNEVA